MSESDTPRVDMWESEFEFHPDTKWRNSLLHLARQLEREVNDLKLDIARHLAICSEQATELAQAQADRDEWKRQAQNTLLPALERAQNEWQKAQARIGELEKDAARYRWIRNSHARIAKDYPDGGLCLPSTMQLDTGIDATLKKPR